MAHSDPHLTSTFWGFGQNGQNWTKSIMSTTEPHGSDMDIIHAPLGKGGGVETTIMSIAQPFVEALSGKIDLSNISELLKAPRSLRKGASAMVTSTRIAEASETHP